MSDLLNIATIMICTAITIMVVAMALTVVWFFDRREKAVGWWCISMWIGTAAALMLAFRGVTPWWFGIGMGNAVTLLAYGLVRAGFAGFVGRRAGYISVLAAPAIWCFFYFGIPAFRDDYNARVILMSVLITGYCAMVFADTWHGWKAERLPSLLAVGALYFSHGLFFAIRAPLTMAFPLEQDFATGNALWFSLIALEAFVHDIGISFTFFALIKERTERRYRLAAEIDSLTSAATRRHFVSETRRLLGKKPEKGVLAVIDLDFFKSINDTHGHMAGDKVLQAFGAHVSSRLAPGMMFGRLGGEEFGLFMRDAAEPVALVFLDKLRAEIAALEIPFMGHSLKITISIGAALTRDAGLDFDHLMAGADNALYVAKDTGRNRVEIFKLAMRMQKIAEAGTESRIGLSGARVSRVAVRSQAARK